MSKFKITYHCAHCGHEWFKIVSDPARKTPRCPNLACGKAHKMRGIDFDAGTAPGIVGASNMVKAVDETAKIVMQDYGLSDMKDNIREGDSCVPSLPPPQQKIADGFFGGKAMSERAGVSRRQMDLLGRRAIAGAFRGAALDVKSVLPDSSVALRSVGKVS